MGRRKRVLHRLESLEINPNDFWISHLGPGVIADAFRWAHAADPDALLCYNDYNIAGEDGTNAKFDAAFAWSSSWWPRECRSTASETRGTSTRSTGSTGLMTQDLQRFASLGLKVAITEADVRTFVEQRDRPGTDRPPGHVRPAVRVLGRCSRHAWLCRQCISFTVWGFADADSWVPGTFTGEGYADLRREPQPEAAYYALQSDLTLAASGAPHRVRTYTPRW